SLTLELVRYMLEAWMVEIGDILVRIFWTWTTGKAYGLETNPLLCCGRQSAQFHSRCRAVAHCPTCTQQTDSVAGTRAQCFAAVTGEPPPAANRSGPHFF